MIYPATLTTWYRTLLYSSHYILNIKARTMLNYNLSRRCSDGQHLSGLLFVHVLSIVLVIYTEYLIKVSQDKNDSPSITIFWHVYLWNVRIHGIWLLQNLCSSGQCNIMNFTLNLQNNSSNISRNRFNIYILTNKQCKFVLYYLRKV